MKNIVLSKKEKDKINDISSSKIDDIINKAFEKTVEKDIELIVELKQYLVN